MRRLLVRSLALAVLAAWMFTLPVSAQTLRWSSRGDPLTMDPHAQNEGLTNSMNGQVYETLVQRDRNLALVPGLALSWQQTGPLAWRVKLRTGVKFQDGAPFTADDVVFSVQRAQQPTSLIKVYAASLGTAVAVDAQTVEFRLPRVDPVFLEHLSTVFMMNRAWCEQHKVQRPLDFKAKEESYAAFHADGTGPYRLVSRQPGIRTTYERNPQWWGRFQGNVQRIVFTPISNDATRLAALISGEIDFVIDPAPRDMPRLRHTAGVKVVDGPENRIIFIGMDQYRDQLLYGSVKDKNPFKDRRVRQAMYQAIDIETLKTKLMNGLAVPTGGLTASPKGAYNDPQLETRLPFDLKAARALMVAAGYPEGFQVTLDCPNNRYINDETICIALATMWSQIKVGVKVNAMPRSLYFPKGESFDTSLFMLGWGGAITDAETTLTPVFRSVGPQGVGTYNWGRVQDAAFDKLALASSTEVDPVKREALIKAALREYREQIHLLPLHRQMIPWAVRSNVDVVHRADNWLEVAEVRVR